MSINLVIASSQQSHNRCAYNDSEQDHMSLITQEIYNQLLPDKRFNLCLIPKLHTGSDNGNLKLSIAMSNDFITKHGDGCHLEFHSDAGYDAHGVSGLYKTAEGKNLIAPIVKELMALTPWTDIGLKQRDNLGALNQTKAISGIIEISFHDQLKEATWIHQNITLIAKTIVSGIYKSFSIYPITPGIKIRINGKFIESDVKPYIKDSRIMTPVRFIAEALGKKVTFNSDTQICDIT